MVGHDDSSQKPRPGRAEEGRLRADVWRPSPEELVNALRRRGECGREGRFRRRARYRCRVRVQLTIVQPGIEGRSSREGVVSTCDVSVDGLSFLWDGFVHPGTAVQVHFESLPDRPLLTGVVRYCTHVEGRRHRVGMEFITSGTDEAW